FSSGNPSHHPVGNLGVNADVPSLLSSWTVNSLMTCMDCHNTDDRSGRAPKGPHGSNFKYLLERNYETNDPASESADAYALCYKCHSRDSIIGDQSFKYHRRHIVEQNTSCSVCHDPHGISSLQGNADNNSHLINFDLTAVAPNISGELAFQDLGRFSGQCSLTCHGREHLNTRYP
ncbi:MAG: cytochrome C, partial [Desulfobacterium sp.]|nr:cytochrome C [Desulfobacterium sp.]